MYVCLSNHNSWTPWQICFKCFNVFSFVLRFEMSPYISKFKKYWNHLALVSCRTVCDKKYKLYQDIYMYIVTWPVLSYYYIKTNGIYITHNRKPQILIGTSVCLYQAQILCGTSHDTRKGLFENLPPPLDGLS